MKKLLIRIRPRGDGKYSLVSEWGFLGIIHKETGLTEEELVRKVVEQVKGTIKEWDK